MRRALTLLVFLGLGITSLPAQEKAVTESGRKVILNPNGTWQLEVSSDTPSTRPGEFKRPHNSTEKAEFNKRTISVYFNPALWKKMPQETPSRQSYLHKDGDGYAVIIAERMQVSLDALKNIALTNAKSAAPDAIITFEENRKVNGTDVLALQIKGTIQGIRFIYYGYYYAGKDGCVQILTYTAENLFNEYQPDFLDFLNGFTLES